jgi:hypothetical protein
MAAMRSATSSSKSADETAENVTLVESDIFVVFGIIF